MGYQKQHKQRYYYAKIREGDTVRSVYLGHQKAVRRLVKRQRAARKRQRDRRRAAAWDLAQLTGSLDEIQTLLGHLVTATLLTAGYHTHHRQWRKKRGGTPMETAPAPAEAPVQAQPSTDLAALIRATSTEKPKPGDLAALRLALRQEGRAWRKAGDLTTGARRVALSKLEPVSREAVFLHVEQMQAELGYAEAPLLERLLIEQVITCWIQLELAQAVAGAAALTSESGKPLRILERQVASIQRRYLQSIDMLLRMRRILLQYSPELLRRGQAGSGPLPHLESERPVVASLPPNETPETANLPAESGI